MANKEKTVEKVENKENNVVNKEKEEKSPNWSSVNAKQVINKYGV